MCIFLYAIVLICKDNAVNFNKLINFSSKNICIYIICMYFSYVIVQIRKDNELLITRAKLVY